MSTSTGANPTEADLRYPIGRFHWPTTADEETSRGWLVTLENFPDRVTAAVSGLQDKQLDTAYRPGGWTVRQVVHHLADSHINSYQRYRLALTEDAPDIKGYREAAWAELADAKTAPVDLSLQLLRGLHGRWVILLRSLSDEQWGRTFVHSERGPMRLDTTTGLYAWHSQHHVAHISALRAREDW